MANLETYRQKRDFAQTPEPRQARTAKTTKQPIFVVQEHAARRLHWDFRLEHSGVLWSFAVPKGPSMDPGDKRLAVHVEDHPLDYAGFEGVIPPGNYGAGTVKLWDRGTWEPEGNAQDGLSGGELKFVLHGQKLTGRFVLVRLKKRATEKAENWLLIKEHDDAQPSPAPRPAPSQRTPRPTSRRGWSPPEGAIRRKLPATQAPMLAATADAPPQGGEWLSEIKFDGYRMLLWKDGTGVRLMTRNGQDWTHRLPHVAQAVAALPAQSCLADGELVALREDGLSHFGDLQAALSEGRDEGLKLYLFDLLFRDGWDLRALPLLARKGALADLVDSPGVIQLSDHLEGLSGRVRQKACAMGLEGIISKRSDAPYRAGRGTAWLKLKCQGREEFCILGWTQPHGSRSGLGSLQLGFFDPDGALHYAGGCGSGFSDQVLRQLSLRLKEIPADIPEQLLLTEERPPPGVRWVKPALVAEVQYTGWSGSLRLRHAVFLGLREDKAAHDVVRAVPDPEAPRKKLGGMNGHSGRFVRAHKPSARATEMDGVRLTHPDRILWPADSGAALTKQDLAAYWRAMAEVALPGIAGRPLALVRCPDGIDGEHFFQKHANRGMPASLREGAFEAAPYLALGDASGLLACAQMAAIELHSWGSRLEEPGRPDRLVFDLDPGEGVGWAAVIHAAHDLKAKLEAEGFDSFCRTSGGKGLHVVVPLRPSADWVTCRAWCRAFAERLARESPDAYVAAVPKARRRGRILIDWLRNGLGSTAIASYSPRARPYAPVATPLAWREVTPRLDPLKFNLRTVPARASRLKTDPWEDFYDMDQALTDSRKQVRKHG